MITKQELRIGNYLKFASPNAEIAIPNIIGTVKAIGLFGDITFNSDPTIDAPDIPLIHCAPLLITNDILSKLGFNRHVHDKKYDFFGYRLGNLILYRVREDARSEEWFYEAEYSSLSFDERTNVCAKLLYLHQLQNLYYSLTGKELTLW